MNARFGDAASPLAGRTILQIIPELEAGGAERTTVDIAGALVEAGARALVACEGGRLISELQARGGEWRAFPAASKNPFVMAFAVRRLRRLIERENIALVHARSRAPAWVAYYAARAAKVPFVTTYHGIYNGESGFKLRYNSIMARGDAVIANSHYTAQHITRLHGLPRERMDVIHRGTNLRAFDPAQIDPARVRALRESWGASPHQPIVLLPGRLTAWKGQLVLIEAAKILRDAGDHATLFVLAGDPQGRDDYVRRIDAAIAAAGLQTRVIRPGHCSDMPAALLAASAVTVCSVEPEAFGRIAVEAQAMGAPLVVSDMGAVTETVLAPPDAPEADRTGWRVPASDPQALAQAIGHMLRLGASEREQLARRARSHVEAHFGLERMCESTLAVYERLLAAARPPGHFSGLA
ncbi:MAG: glycosyltransferase family 4 protein [Alphaproteobacteria bacterium]|nr:glycosyltransferase family 4 protein [Alphaproteobacteria bacterium]